jgi:hypothetical protein
MVRAPFGGEYLGDRILRINVLIMKLQAIYDRLQCDLASIYGICPQLDSSRAPRYEALWKNLLDVIEWLGTEKCSDIHDILTVERPDDSYCLLQTPRDVELHRVLKGQGPEASSFFIPIPHELVSLVYTFCAARNPRVLQLLRQICLLTYKSKSNEVTNEQEARAIAGFSSRNATCQKLSEAHYRLLSRDSGPAGKTIVMARLLINIILDRCDWSNIQPSHGPGAVSDSKKGLDKWRTSMVERVAYATNSTLSRNTSRLPRTYLIISPPAIAIHIASWLSCRRTAEAPALFALSPLG